GIRVSADRKHVFARRRTRVRVAGRQQDQLGGNAEPPGNLQPKRLRQRAAEADDVRRDDHRRRRFAAVAALLQPKGAQFQLVENRVGAAVPKAVSGQVEPYGRRDSTAGGAQQKRWRLAHFSGLPGGTKERKSSDVASTVVRSTRA